MGFHELLVFVRANVGDLYCTAILEMILQYIDKMNKDLLPSFKVFKMELLKKLNCKIKNIIAELLDFSNFNYLTDNVDEIFRYLPIIRVSILKIIDALNSGNNRQALALLNVIHCLPEALINKKVWNSRSFWENRIKLYRKTWDNDFAKKEEYDLLHKNP